MKKKRVIGVIPARWASTRLPGKPLVILSGKPMIQHVVERVIQATSLNTVLVATDDQRIIDAVTLYAIPEVKAILTRSDHSSGTDRIAEVIKKEPCDVVINIQGDEPLIDPVLIDRLAKVMNTDEWDMATAAAPIRNQTDLNDPSIVKTVFAHDGQALYFSRSPIPHIRDADTNIPNAHWRHLGIYAYRRDYLLKLAAEPPCMLETLEKLEQLRALHIGCRMNVLQTEKVSIGVDTPDDIKKIETLLQT